jgi:uncharacterized membrane protein YkoI
VNRKTKWGVGGAAAAVLLAAAGTGIAVAAGGDDDGSETPITGPALERASAAALEETGGGRVTETEAGDEEGAYEVEVTLDDGRQVDVHLDKDFAVINSSSDREGDDDGSGADDD